ncbi:hypothetical protein BDN71DRAFT_1505766 [Pleurotus eryngii]|uniref:DUF4246 domain-containing protein n=1 Tax=Pleurotus eryngii TaxID=5323 RepID=A0A9P6DHI1_PLEER|nr:hypothetical protein BDN71DRAFT_1505766 [Pleurotus eryngii]
MDADSSLRRFCDAVRAKENWIHKVSKLGEKWAQEAKLNDIPASEGVNISERVRDTSWELRAEAERIRKIDHEINLHSTRLPKRPIDLEQITRESDASLAFVAESQFGIRPPKLRDLAGIYVSDGLVPPCLHRELVTELDALANLEPKDYHPGTVGKVQDLIHPSLCPYIVDFSPVIPGVTPHTETYSTMICTEDISIPHESIYAWIPSIFTVSEGGNDVSIDSYINGLGPRNQFPTLYRLLEKVFLFILPHFERTLEAELESSKTNSVERWEQRTSKRAGTSLDDWKLLLEHQAKEKAKFLAEEEAREEDIDAQIKNEWDNRRASNRAQEAAPPSPFAGMTLKVIVKAANYVLQPGQDYQGTWHLEGMPHERIVASAIYYYDNNEWICDQGLGFRRVRRPEEDFPIFMEHNADDFYVRQLFPKKEEDLDSQPEVNYDAPVIRDYPSDSDYDRSHVSLGTITTTYSESSPPTTGHGTGRIVSFPNWIQHKVMGVRHAEVFKTVNSPPAIRKILCFFLVDDAEAEDGRMDFPGVSYLNLPDAPVLSTADVPWQARPTNMPTLRVLLPKACKQVIGKTLPPELVELIVGEDVYGMSREQAEMHRRDFMADRKAKVADENDIFDGEHKSHNKCLHTNSFEPHLEENQRYGISRAE